MRSNSRTLRARDFGTLLALVLAAGAASCGGGSKVKSDIVFAPAGTSKPEQWAYHKLGATDGIVRCTATADTNPDAVFDFSIAKKFDVVPVKLSVNLISKDHQVNLSEATMQPVLFLENGTALEVVDPATMRKKIEKKKLAAFDENLFEDQLLQNLGRSETEAEGYLFFQLPGDDQGEKTELLVAGPANSAYEVSLRRSLLRFTYEIDENGRQTQRTINVGTK